MTKVAVVTGGNKGIGLAIVERLAKELKGWSVYLTARNPELGLASLKQLADKGVKVNFHQLDITSEQSIEKIAGYFKEKYGGIDILVNNAGIAYKRASTASVGEQAEVTMMTNFFGTLNVCKHLFPLLNPHARVVHVSSLMARVAVAKVSVELRKKFTSPMTMVELVDAMNQYVTDAKAGTHLEKGWADTSYGMSKLAVTVMCIIQQKEFTDDSREDLVVNACCPGYVNTDMSSGRGQLTPDQGADTPCYLAMLPPNITSPKGEHVYKREIQPWTAEDNTDPEQPYRLIGLM